MNDNLTKAVVSIVESMKYNSLELKEKMLSVVLRRLPLDASEIKISVEDIHKRLIEFFYLPKNMTISELEMATAYELEKLNFMILDSESTPEIRNMIFSCWEIILIKRLFNFKKGSVKRDYSAAVYQMH